MQNLNAFISLHAGESIHLSLNLKMEFGKGQLVVAEVHCLFKNTMNQPVLTISFLFDDFPQTKISL